MKTTLLPRFSSLLLLAALAACGGGGSASSPLVPSRGPQGQPPGSILSSIVGVGDSLTAGYQSNGFSGATGVRNPSGFYVPPGQENGWWADLYEQASGKPLGTAIAQMYDPAVSPLPLIASPGLNDQLIPSGNPFFPFTPEKSGNICTTDHGFNQQGYLLSGLSRVRMNPKSTTVRDVGIPGLTLHEANVLHQPQTNTCEPIAGIPGLLSLVVADESGTFWPVLGNFTKLPVLTDVNAAASRHPTLATVWLGANDVLKYMGSGGRFVGGDRNAAQAESDLRASVSTLEKAGAHVVVANLPSILETGYFQRVTIPKSNKACLVQTFASCILALDGIPSYVVTEIAKKYHLATPGGCTPATSTRPCGYLTLAGTVAVLQNYPVTQKIPNLDCSNPAPKCKGAPGNGLGQNYITPEFAGKVQALNDAINQGIDDAATASKVPLVNVEAIFHGLASGDPTDPFFHLAASINPGVCCTLGYLQGMLSFDGLHPSNTGYALIAYVFIETINKAYGTHIAQIDVKAAYNGTRCSNADYCFADPYAPH